jgi:hypothetical protein
MRRVRGVLCRFAVLIVFILAVSGCATRSISDSGYRAESGYRSQTSSHPFYKGELSEFQILGISPEIKITQEDINRAFESNQRLTLPKGSSIMIIQSGAMIPDEPMVKALEKYYSVSVFSGVPPSGDVTDYAMSLRFAAAKGGYEKIVAYWGMLETARKGLATRTISLGAVGRRRRSGRRAGDAYPAEGRDCGREEWSVGHVLSGALSRHCRKRSLHTRILGSRPGGLA